MDADAEKRFLTAEQDVERHSAELKKELSLNNLVLTQILYIVGLGWIGTAAKLGGPHLFFWMAAVVLFLHSFRAGGGSPEPRNAA
jgi:hypothetical protein